MKRPFIIFIVMILVEFLSIFFISYHFKSAISSLYIIIFLTEFIFGLIVLQILRSLYHKELILRLNHIKQNKPPKRNFNFDLLFIFTLVILFFMIISTILNFYFSSLQEFKTSKPEIKLNEDFPLLIEVNSNAPNWTNAIKAFDKQDGEITVTHSSIIYNDVNLNALGTYEVKYLIFDKDYNQARYTITIRVVDSIKPKLILNGEGTVHIFKGNPYIEEGVQVIDYEAGLANKVKITSNVNTNENGNYEVLYEVSDSSGNTASIKRIVIVSEDLSLVIDPILATYIKVALGKYPKQAIFKEECETFTGKLSIPRGEITDFSGIKYLKNITELELINNGLTDISPLKDLTNLKALTIINNPITDISPLKALYKIKNLTIINTPVHDISVLRHLPYLQSLTLNQTIVENISVLSELQLLRIINLDSNPIKDFTPISNHPYLEVLSLSNTGFNDFPILLEGLSQLKELRLKDNDYYYSDIFDDIDFNVLGELNSLQILDLSDNVIMKLPDLSQLRDLNILLLQNNFITDFSSLTELNSSSNSFYMYIYNNSFQKEHIITLQEVLKQKNIIIIYDKYWDVGVPIIQLK